MKIEGNVLTADEGKAIRRKGDEEPSTVRRVALTDGDSPDNWEDCFYGIPRKYSTLMIKRELAKIGKWDATKQFLEIADAWDDYVLANYISENDPLFVQMRDALERRGVVSNAQLNNLLPKCIWTAD